ncbi:Proton-dependent oligopeptide transporter family [Dillenia turbinata]|uniref:Proton-dependent oligopeptide transporter family n=1 Tax=Dillenia turbinata TaxID=194707 RepID=A0AAN8VID6_9MAGN
MASSEDDDDEGDVAAAYVGWYGLNYNPDLWLPQIAPEFVVWLLMPYLTDVWELNLSHAAAIVNVFEGSTSLLGILATFLYDTWPGHYFTTLLSTFTYGAGLGLLFASAPPLLSKILNSCTEYRPECITEVQRKLFYAALYLVAFGKAGTGATLLSFLKEQGQRKQEEIAAGLIAPEKNEGAEKISYSIFGALLLLVGAFVLPFIKSWMFLFGVASFTMLFVSYKLIRAYKSHYHVRPPGSPLTSVAKVFVNAVFGKLYTGVSIRIVCVLLLGIILFPLQKFFPWLPSFSFARSTCSQILISLVVILLLPVIKLFKKIFSCNKRKEPVQSNASRCSDKRMLCSVSEAEIKQAMIMLKMIPICITFLIPGLVLSTGNTYFTEQANGLNRSIFGLQIPLTYVQWLFARHKRSAKRVYKNFRQRRGMEAENYRMEHVPVAIITIGNAYAILTCVVAAFVEARRLGVIRKHDLINKPEETIPMSFIWIVPQFWLLGRAYGYIQDGINGFFMDQLPEAMEDYAGPFADGVLGAGSILGVIAVHLAGSWFGSTLSLSHLHYFYWVLAFLIIVNVTAFWTVSKKYPYKEGKPETEDDAVEVPEFNDDSSVLTAKD